MGDETRQITNKLEDTIMGIYNRVGDITITQATIIANGKSMHTDIKKLNGRLGKVENKTDSLEATRDSEKGMRKVKGWVFGFVVGVPGLIWGAIRVVEWLKT